MPDSSVISISVMPSAKYSSSARPVRFSSGRTAMERTALRTGLNGVGAGSGVRLSRISSRNPAVSGDGSML
jgi:hypothetical protein